MKKILLIEDDNEYRNLLSSRLKKDGFEVHEALNGEQGINYLKKESADLILLDLVMDKMDGLSFYKRIKSHLNIKIPILILSNIVLSDMHELIKEPLIEDYLIKANTNLLELTKKIHTLLTS